MKFLTGEAPGRLHRTSSQQAGACRTLTLLTASWRRGLGGRVGRTGSPAAGWRRAVATGLLCVGLPMGCGGDARLEFAAADALSAVAAQMDVALREYHQEVVRGDDRRESAAVAAFIARVRADAADEAAADAHAADFQAALLGIREDRQTEWSRRTAAMDNVSVLREVARGLQKLAIESLTLDDEMRRYLDSWMQTRRRAAELAGDRSGGAAAR